MDPAAMLDLARHPLDRSGSPERAALVAWAEAELAREGMFNLDGFVRPEAVAAMVAEVAPLFPEQSFFHQRRHNIYFKDHVDGLPPDHPALARCETTNHTVCADQIAGGVIDAVYGWPPLAAFLAEVMGKPALYPMGDPLARLNVMQYRDGEALNWHFDRAEFTTTLLLQQPLGGGAFEYRTGLRTETDPNHDGVARLLRGEDPETRRMDVAPGTLNVFRGRNTAHRVTPVEGPRDRIIAVFSYYERPGVMFSAEERRGFYGRAA